jgi:hypothetical protein
MMMCTLDQKEYVKTEVSLNLPRLIVVSTIATIPIALVCGFVFYSVWGYILPPLDYYMQNMLYIFIIMNIVFIVGAIIHELIHGLFFAIFAKDGFKAVKFGVIWKMVTPYCHCKEPLKLTHYALGAIMPTILLGIVPAAIAFLSGNLALLVFGILFTVAGGGDIAVILSMRKENLTAYIEDHPEKVGYFVYRPANDSMIGD